MNEKWRRWIHWNEIVTVNSGEFQAGRGREETVATFPAAHARCFEQITGEIVVERILARRILAIQWNAFKAVYSLNCVPNSKKTCNYSLRIHQPTRSILIDYSIKSIQFITNIQNKSILRKIFSNLTVSCK